MKIMQEASDGNRGSWKGWLLQNRAKQVGLATLLSLLSSQVPAQNTGIPEPDLIMYGTVWNTLAGYQRQVVGTLAWEFQPVGGGTPVTRTATLTNINDQFSYSLRVPCETVPAGFVLYPNTLRLGASYTRAQVRLDGTNLCTFVQPALTNLALSSTDRGLIQRVDLEVAAPCEDEDLPPNGLPDCWEKAFFGRTGVDPNEDPDGDGLTNLEEYKSGTHPLDARSRFAFMNVQSVAGRGVLIQWSSVAGHSYYVQRSSDLLIGFTNLANGAFGATPPVNSYTDTTATGPGPYFYRIRLDQ